MRILIDTKGVCEASWTQLNAPSWGAGPLKALLSASRTDSSNIFLRNKTTSRKLYDSKFKEAHGLGFDEALFMNERGEFAEGAISNVIVKTCDGRALTPAVDCGLLPGLWRAERMRKEQVKEAIISLDCLKQALEIRIGNSVRGGGALDELWLEGEDGRTGLIWRRPRSARLR